MNIRVILTVFLLFALLYCVSGQENNSNIRGDFQSDFQIYQPDSAIGAPDVPEKMLFNGYLNLIYSKEKFSAGVRFESYQNALLGYDPRYKGNGIASRWAAYKHKDFEVTVGNFYEQFGGGMILRSYEDRSLGIDNSIDGIKIHYSPYKGILLKGVVGQHRYFFDKGVGIVRGSDLEMALNEIIEKWEDSDLRIILGSGFVSKYQQDRDPIYVLPENVAAFASRVQIVHKNKRLFAEYAHKINDPSSVNNMIYKDGSALYINGSYSTKGFSTFLALKRIDNMDFRSDRTATGNVLQINYLPALSVPHVYTLPGFYPYATQTLGEAGLQGRIAYKIPKDTKLGGKYGTDVAFEFSRIHDINKTQINDTIPIGKSGTLGYTSNFFKLGDELFFQDISLSIGRKVSKKLRIHLEGVHLIYNVDIIEGHEGGMVYAHVEILDLTYKLKSTKTIKAELQHMTTKQDDGNWAMGLIEYSIAPKWSLGLSSLYNYGNENKDKRNHYFVGSISYAHNASRLAISYGKQREGILCVGGVCRYVPASNGVTISLNTNF